MKRVLLIVAVLIGMSLASAAAQAHWRRHYNVGVDPYGPRRPYYGQFYAQRVYGSYYGYPSYYEFGPGMPAGIGVY